VAAKEERQALQDPKPVAAAEAINEERDEAADLEILARYSQLRADGNFEEATKMFSADARWVTLYKKSLEGSEEIGNWMNREKEKGRANLTEGQWYVDGDKYSRELTTRFPRGGLHEVIQSAVISRGYIKEVKIAPKWQAHALAIDFALAREQGDDQTALEKMSASVVWKTWDNAEIAGKAAVAELMAEQRRHGERRDGTSDFEALGDVTAELGIFERAMDIQRSDGVRVCGTQTLTVKGNPLKITEVYVHPETEMKDGQWVTPAERTRSDKYHAPGQSDNKESDKKGPKCGCAVM
jgi:hypothetical protein